jgi:hypothetical protein
MSSACPTRYSRGEAHRSYTSFSHRLNSGSGETRGLPATQFAEWSSAGCAGAALIRGWDLGLREARALFRCLFRWVLALTQRCWGERNCASLLSVAGKNFLDGLARVKQMRFKCLFFNVS